MGAGMMKTGQLNQVLRELEKASQMRDSDVPSDAELLEQFISRRDEEAFAGLVRRHGPMVLGVCRRMLPNLADAEDAFQATFLVLVRKAQSIGRRDLLGNWLYGTACRAALEARAARRRVRERQVDDMPEREVRDEADVWRELRPVLDDELNRLPDKYRLAVVLCDLEGRSRKEVAARLGIPEGTLSSRLNTARQRLAQRLARRGVTLGAGAVATALAGSAAAVPAPLQAATVKAASLWAAGEMAAGIISAQVAAITEGVLRTMLVKKLKVAALSLLILATLGTGAALFAYQTAARLEPPDPPEAAQGEPKKAPPDQTGEGKAAQAAGPQQLVFAAYAGDTPQIYTYTAGAKVAVALTKGQGIWCTDPSWSADGTKIVFLRVSQRKGRGGFFAGICVMDADGGNIKQLTKEGNADFRPSFSPDGKTVIFSTNTGTGTLIRAIDVDGENLRELAEDNRRPMNADRDPAWSPDGKKIAFSRGPAVSICLSDPDGGNVAELTRTGADMHPVWSPDGTKIAFLSMRDGNGPELFVMNADGSNVKKLTPRDGKQHRASDPAWSPDGKRILFSDNGPVDWEIFVVNADGANHTQLTSLGGQNLRSAWSPDGKKVAFLSLMAGKSVPNNTAVYIMDPDGKNQTEVHGCPQYLLGRVEWRPTGGRAKQAPGEEPKKPTGKVDPPGTPLELRLRAVKDTYPLNLGGRTADQFRRQLRAAARGDREHLEPPAVELTVELVNTGTKDLEVWIGGDIVQAHLDLAGPDAVTCTLDTVSDSDVRPPRAIPLQAGQSHRLKLTSLVHGCRGRAFGSYWLATGKYTLTARLSTGVSPVPTGAQLAELDKRFGHVEVTSNPLQLTVVAGKPAEEPVEVPFVLRDVPLR
jgi:RNA polymerase sigma factor (sigma-70 family)